MWDALEKLWAGRVCCKTLRNGLTAGLTPCHLDKLGNEATAQRFRAAWIQLVLLS